MGRKKVICTWVYVCVRVCVEQKPHWSLLFVRVYCETCDKAHSDKALGDKPAISAVNRS